jgi:hypothetical protein
MECGSYKEIYFNLYKTSTDNWNRYYEWSQTPKSLTNDSITIYK